jgi:hypothetical protein
VKHAFSVAADGGRQELGCSQTVVWLGPRTTAGHDRGLPWRDYTLAQTTTVHQTDDLDYIAILQGKKGGRP